MAGKGEHLGTGEGGVPGRVCDGIVHDVQVNFRRLPNWREVPSFLHIWQALAESDTLRTAHLTTNHVFIHVPFIISLSWQICFLFKMVSPTLSLKKVPPTSFIRNKSLNNITLSPVVGDLEVNTAPSAGGENYEVPNNL